MGVAHYDDFTNVPRWCVRRDLDYTYTDADDNGAFLIRGRSNRFALPEGPADVGDVTGLVPVITKLHFNGYAVISTGGNDDANIRLGWGTPSAVAGLSDLTPTALTQTTIEDTGAFTSGVLQGTLVRLYDNLNKKTYWATVRSNTANTLTLDAYGLRPDGASGLGTPGNFRFTVYKVANFEDAFPTIWTQGTAATTDEAAVQFYLDDIFVPLPAGKAFVAIHHKGTNQVGFTRSFLFAEGILLPASNFSRTMTRFQPA